MNRHYVIYFYQNLTDFYETSNKKENWAYSKYPFLRQEMGLFRTR